MNTIHSLGAINKHTGEYVYPKIANKKDEYSCPDCRKDLILCQGEIRVHHFRHKVDTINPCHYYNKPSESQIHKDAKMLMKMLLDKKTPIAFIRNCANCKKNEEFEIPEISETSSIQLEHRFDYNGLKIADVAYLDTGEIVCIFEICNTHKTSSENRPEPWFEIDALTLIGIANDNSVNSLKIPCIRCEKCEKCVDKEKTDEIERKNRIKQEKIIKIKKEIINLGNRRNNIDSDDDADIMRAMRYDKQDINHKKSLTTELIFIENDIKYDLGNNVAVIEHPVTKTKIKQSMIKQKTFYKGKWRENISKNLLIKWYNSMNDILDQLY